ncbi:Pathogenicity island SaPIn1 [Levilactobacillus brevis]|nr:Pathogenicity island SaPIn1 [Levilactobacillus brevis]
METTGRRDITATAEETSSVELSHNLTTVTTEIKAYQSIGGQAIFEIGRRLKWVKENDLAHGEFGKWVKSLDIERTFATRAMKITSELDSNYATGHNLGMKALYEIATMPSDERDKPQKLDSGEIKKPDEMTVRELRETKRKLAASCSENQKNRIS